MEPNLILYHCNDIKRCHKFLKDTNYLIATKEDGKWLGSGMYFWDNTGNAEYWFKEKKKKDSDMEFIIVKAQVVLNKLLDLTDKNVCKSMELLWTSYKNAIHKNDDVDTGKKINILFDYYQQIFKPEYNVVKVFGQYRDDNTFIEYNPNSKIPQPTLGVKCIYCVKAKECIINREEVNT